jgi:hypothetical protein
MAVADEYKLDKEQSVENDVLDVFRLEMDIYVLSNQKSLYASRRVFHIIQWQKLTAAYEALRKMDSRSDAMKKSKMKTVETQETQLWV